MVKAFIFDLDGIITDTAEFHYAAWKEIAGKYGISIDYSFNERLKGVSRMESLERVLIFGGKNDVFTAKEKAEIANLKNTYYQTLIGRLTPDNILPGIYDLLCEMKEKGYKIGLASASKNAETILELLKLTDMFDVVADITAVKASKPAPDIFLLAASALGVSADQSIGIEDAESGIESILRAGMFAVGVGNPESLKQADYFVHHTEELSIEKMIAAWERSRSKMIS